jgi:hypothetical protein
MSERWGDSRADREALDRWITDEPGQREPWGEEVEDHDREDLEHGLELARHTVAWLRSRGKDEAADALARHLDAMDPNP